LVGLPTLLASPGAVLLFVACFTADFDRRFREWRKRNIHHLLSFVPADVFDCDSNGLRGGVERRTSMFSLGSGFVRRVGVVSPTTAAGTESGREYCTRKEVLASSHWWRLGVGTVWDIFIGFAILLSSFLSSYM